MNQFLAWLNMGGYANYVWPAYALVFAVLGMNLLGIKRQKIRTRKKIQRWYKG